MRSFSAEKAALQNAWRVAFTPLSASPASAGAALSVEDESEGEAAAVEAGGDGEPASSCTGSGGSWWHAAMRTAAKAARGRVKVRGLMCALF
jgi:hypothetical protein